MTDLTEPQTLQPKGHDGHGHVALWEARVTARNGALPSLGLPAGGPPTLWVDCRDSQKVFPG